MKIKLHLIFEELFQVSLITYLILLFAETIKEGFVSYFFNVHLLLGVVVVSGIGLILTLHERTMRRNSENMSLNDWQYLIILSIAGGLFVYFKTEILGTIAYIITLFTMIVIFLLSYLIMTETKNPS